MPPATRRPRSSAEAEGREFQSLRARHFLRALMSFWRNSRFRALAFIVSLALFALPLARAQSGACLQGVVSDKAGGLIVGASVSLSSKDKTLQTKSDWRGRFKFRDLSPGTYKLEIEQIGFETATVQPLHIERGDTAMPPLTVTMEVAVMGRCGGDSSISYEERTPRSSSLVGTIQPMPPKPEPNVDWHLPVPLSEATIEVLEVGSDRVVASTHPDARGRFEFTGLATGKYVLRAKYKGYYDQRSTKFHVTREDVTAVTMSMVPQSEVAVCM